MKKILITAFTFICFGFYAKAQIAFVDSKYILNKMPDYRDSLAIIDHTAQIWQKEIDDKEAVVEKMTLDYERDEVMLSDEIKKKRSDDLLLHRKEVRELQRARFGYEGDLVKMRKVMLEPMEDSVKVAIQKTANRLSYTIILDKSEGVTVIYTNPKLEITHEVLKDMGLER